MSDHRRLLRITEVADCLGLSRSTVYELVLTGALASVKIGRARRVPSTAVDAWVADQIAVQSDEAGHLGRGR